MEARNGTLVAVVIGVLCLVIGIPLFMERVKPYQIYGFRIRETLEHTHVWYAVNARSGKHFIVTGAILTLLGLAAIVVANSGWRQNVVMVAAMLIALGGPLYSGATCYRMAKSMAARRAQAVP
jgi:SdpI/YfhL protein family